MRQLIIGALLLVSSLCYGQANTYKLLGDTVFHKVVVYSEDEFSQKELMIHYMTEAGMAADTESQYDIFYKEIFNGEALFPIEENQVVVIELWIIKFNSSNIIKQ